MRTAGLPPTVDGSLEGLAADTEAERAVLDARLRELARKLEETLART